MLPYQPCCIIFPREPRLLAVGSDSPDGTVVLRGPYYNAEYERSLSNGAFSDELFSCCSDPLSAILSIWPLSVITMWRIAERLPLTRFPMGVRTTSAFIGLYCLCTFVLIIPYVNYLGLVCLVFILYRIYMQTVEKFRIRQYPTEGMVLVQAVFCHCCLLSQVARHVGRAKGYIPPLALVENEVLIRESDREVV